MRHGSLNVISNTECSKLNSKYLPITSQMLCGSNKPRGQQSACYGDFGGPFVCQQQDGKWILHGLGSWSSPTCDSTDANTVFTRISEFRNWIDSVI